MIIGITGSSGCGKTTALNTLQQLGATILDCDAIYHRLLKEDNALLNAISNRFPEAVKDGALDRAALATTVFSNPAALEDLNKITHGAVVNEVKRQLAFAPALAAIDAYALFESGLNKLCNVTVAITAPEELRIARIVNRDDITPEKAKERLSAQRPQEEISALCDYTLCNNGTQAEFEAKCLAFWGKLCYSNEKGESL